jgi:hypothetical protein
MRARAVSAFLAAPVDPFEEYHRLSAQFDRQHDQLARAASAFTKCAAEACDRNHVAKDSSHD